MKKNIIKSLILLSLFSATTVAPVVNVYNPKNNINLHQNKNIPKYDTTSTDSIELSSIQSGSELQKFWSVNLLQSSLMFIQSFVSLNPQDKPDGSAASYEQSFDNLNKLSTGESFSKQLSINWGNKNNEPILKNNYLRLIADCLDPGEKNARNLIFDNKRLVDVEIGGQTISMPCLNFKYISEIDAKIFNFLGIASIGSQGSGIKTIDEQFNILESNHYDKVYLPKTKKGQTPKQMFAGLLNKDYTNKNEDVNWSLHRKQIDNISDIIGTISANIKSMIIGSTIASALPNITNLSGVALPRLLTNLITGNTDNDATKQSVFLQKQIQNYCTKSLPSFLSNEIGVDFIDGTLSSLIDKNTNKIMPARLDGAIQKYFEELLLSSKSIFPKEKNRGYIYYSFYRTPCLENILEPIAKNQNQFLKIYKNNPLKYDFTEKISRNFSSLLAICSVMSQAQSADNLSNKNSSSSASLNYALHYTKDNQYNSFLWWFGQLLGLSAAFSGDGATVLQYGFSRIRLENTLSTETYNKLANDYISNPEKSIPADTLFLNEINMLKNNKTGFSWVGDDSNLFKNNFAYGKRTFNGASFLTSDILASNGKGIPEIDKNVNKLNKNYDSIFSSQNIVDMFKNIEKTSNQFKKLHESEENVTNSWINKISSNLPSENESIGRELATFSENFFSKNMNPPIGIRDQYSKSQWIDGIGGELRLVDIQESVIREFNQLFYDQKTGIFVVADKYDISLPGRHNSPKNNNIGFKTFYYANQGIIISLSLLLTALIILSILILLRIRHNRILKKLTNSSDFTKLSDIEEYDDFNNIHFRDLF